MIAVLVTTALGCSSSSEPAVECMDTQICVDAQCPEFCEGRGRVLVAVCEGAGTRGSCHCVCESESGAHRCASGGFAGAAFETELVTSESECDADGPETQCEAACEIACVWNFGVFDSACQSDAGTALCECLCGVCHFTG